MHRTANDNHKLMHHHRFPAGHKVRLNGPKRYSNAASGVYDISGLLPERDGELQYRIKSDLESYHRVVSESQIEKA